LPKIVDNDLNQKYRLLEFDKICFEDELAVMNLAIRYIKESVLKFLKKELKCNTQKKSRL